MRSQSDRNLLIFTAISSIWATVMGLIGPFYIIYVSNLSGGYEKLGMAFGIVVLARSASTYLAGKYSDKLGRKRFLFVTAYADASILICYTFIKEIHLLYILQAIMGMSGGILQTIETSLLSDLTSKSCRGSGIGKFNALIDLSSAAGLIAGGYLAKVYGIKYLFYMASGVIASSSLLLFSINEAVCEENE